MNLKDILPHDNQYIFSVGDISENVLISTGTGDEMTVPGSLQADEVRFDQPSGTALNAYNVKLYCQDQDGIVDFKRNSVIYINRKGYRVLDSRLEMGVWEVSLERRQ